jgi:hypothetical protein
LARARPPSPFLEVVTSRLVSHSVIIGAGLDKASQFGVLSYILTDMCTNSVRFHIR